MKIKQHIWWFLFIAVVLVSCSNSSEVKSTDDNLPYIKYDDFPDIIDNPENKITAEKAELGRHLFFEKALSKDRTMSCNVCHQPQNAFATKGMPLSYTSGGLSDSRNVPSIFNIGFYTVYNWDGHSTSLEEMIHEDFTAITIFQNNLDTVINRISSIPKYKKLYYSAYGTDDITIEGLTNALAVFVRTIVSGNSRYDRYVRGDKSALNESEIRGMKLFMSDRAQCSVCHKPPLFTDLQFHNTGITTHYFDFGRYYVTNDYRDRGKFRTPTLRNIGFTPPYMHNGELETLDDVIEHYSHGGRPFINKSEFVKRRDFTQMERADLKAFLLSLSDSSLVNSERYKGVK